MGVKIDDEGESSEESYTGDVNGERDSWSDRWEWMSDETKVTCVIWCGKMLFWHLVIRAVGLRVTCIWGGSEVWRSQFRKWWPDTPWYKKK